MKASVLMLLVCVAAAQAIADEPGGTEQGDRIEHIEFRSNALKGLRRYCVVLPAGYHEHRDSWPVLFLFHGRGRDERSLIDAPDTRSALLSAPFVTVLPDGADGWYINSPVRKQDRYADYVDEVMRHARSRFRISDDRARRGLSGWSMGGYGAVMVAQRHPERFGAVATVIGLLDFPRTGLPEGQDYSIPTDRFSGDHEVWRQMNPIHAADRLEGMRLLVITADQAFDRTMNENFHDRLTELGIEHHFEVLRGGHSFEVVREAIPRIVEFMSSALTDVAVQSSPEQP